MARVAGHMTVVRRASMLWVLSVAAAVVALAGASLSPAAADPGMPPEARTTSVVTRLSLDENGAGWLTVQPRWYTAAYAGFDVFIPAGQGAWSGPARVAVPELGTSCVRDPGPDLFYRCGQTRNDDPSWQPPYVGGYQVTFKVTHTGSAAGLWGTSSVYGMYDSIGPDGLSSNILAANTDPFPVYQSPHFRSSAEVRMVPVTYPDASGTVQAKLAATVTVVPGERVTALDLELGDLQWHLTGSNASRYGIQCFVRRVLTASLHCKTTRYQREFHVGRLPLSFDLSYRKAKPQSPRFEGHSRSPSAVAMTVDNGPSAKVDEFYWDYLYYY